MPAAPDHAIEYADRGVCSLSPRILKQAANETGDGGLHTKDARSQTHCRETDFLKRFQFPFDESPFGANRKNDRLLHVSRGLD